MTERDDRRPERDETAGAREAELFELLLQADPDASDTTRATRLVELARDPARAADLERARATLRHARELRRREEWSTERERRLTKSILSRTTRLDPGWRGDLRLVTDFVRERWATSRQLRVAAMLLFLNGMVVLPALAWVALHRVPGLPHFFTGIVSKETPREVEDEALELDWPELDEEERLASHWADRRENTSRSARFLLQRTATGAEPVASAEPLERLAAEAFALRRELCAGSFAPERDLQRLEELARSASALEPSIAPVGRSLVALVALDSAVLTGTRPLVLNALLNDLALAEADAALDALGLHVLERAREQGAWRELGSQGIAARMQTPPLLPCGPEEERALEAVLGEDWRTLRGW